MEQLENAFRQGHDLGRIRGLARTLGISDDKVNSLQGRFSGGNGRESGSGGGFFGGSGSGGNNRGYNDDSGRGGYDDYRNSGSSRGQGYDYQQNRHQGYSNQQQQGDFRRDYDESASPEPRGRRNEAY